MREFIYYGHQVLKVQGDVYCGPNGFPLSYVTRNLGKSTRLPRVTVCAVYDEDINTLQFGVAVCSPKDTYRRIDGYSIAMTRAEDNPIFCTACGKRNPGVVFKEFAKEIEQKFVPKLKEYL